MNYALAAGRRVLNRLLRDGRLRTLAEQDGKAALLAQAVRDALSGSLSDEEREAVTRIERRRAELEASSEVLTGTDYGAGDPSARRSHEIMTIGVPVTRAVGDFCRLVSKSPFWGRVLFKAVRATRPSSGVEMGTALGISAAYQGAAMALNGVGTLTSLEGDERVAAKGQETLVRLGLGNVDVVVGRFHDTLERVLRARVPVDYLFVDGHHDEEATIGYFRSAAPFLADGAVVVLDDIRWSPGMYRAWRSVISSARVELSVDLGNLGICVLPPAGGRGNYLVPVD